MRQPAVSIKIFLIPSSLGPFRAPLNLPWPFYRVAARYEMALALTGGPPPGQAHSSVGPSANSATPEQVCNFFPATNASLLDDTEVPYETNYLAPDAAGRRPGERAVFA